MRRPLLGLVAVALGAAVACSDGRGDDRDGAAPDEGPVSVQVLGLNDFHGHLEARGDRHGRVGEVAAGGAAYLATHIEQLERTNPNTVVVSAGDLFGNSPLLSALFHDEPTVEAMNEVGLDVNAMGNHELDEGVAEVRRMVEGGCHGRDGCRDGNGYGGADFAFLAANTVDEETGRTLFPPYTVERFDGVEVAFIGVTLEGTGVWTGPAAVAGHRFLDEADTVNALVPELREGGVEAVVVLMHEGGGTPTLEVDGCDGIAGPVVDIVRRMDDEVDLVLSGHTHEAYRCVLDGTPVSSAYAYGRLVTDVDLTIDRRSGEVREVVVDNRVVTRDVPVHPAIASLIDRYRTAAHPIAGRVVGRVAADVTRADDDSVEQSLGDALADAQLAATPGSDVALVRSGGIRADLDHASSPAGEGHSVVTYGEAFTAQPLDTPLVTMALTGIELERVLEEQFCGINAGRSRPDRVLLPSAGLSYTWDPSAPAAEDCDLADRVDATSITLRGRPLDPEARYVVTVDTFLAAGGDGHPTLARGRARERGVTDLDALLAHLAAAGPEGLVPPERNRIQVASRSRG